MSDELELDMEALLAVFREETRELLEGIDAGCAQLEQGAAGPEATKELVRRFHTLAGACSSMGVETAGQLARTFERKLKPLRDAATPPSPALLGLCMQAATELRQLIADRERPGSTAAALQEQLGSV